MRPSAVALLALFLVGCAPEVGSERWCKKMEQTERGEWTMNDAADFARHCILR